MAYDEEAMGHQLPVIEASGTHCEVGQQIGEAARDLVAAPRARGNRPMVAPTSPAGSPARRRT